MNVLMNDTSNSPLKLIVENLTLYPKGFPFIRFNGIESHEVVIDEEFNEIANTFNGGVEGAKKRRNILLFNSFRSLQQTQFQMTVE